MPIIVPHANVCMSVLLGSNCCWARVTVDRCEFVCLLWLRSTEGHYAIPSNWDWYSMSVLFWRVTTTALKCMATDALAINKDTDMVRKRLISALESHWLKSYLKIRSHHFTALFRNCCFFFLSLISNERHRRNHFYWGDPFGVGFVFNSHLYLCRSLSIITVSCSFHPKTHKCIVLLVDHAQIIC